MAGKQNHSSPLATRENSTKCPMKLTLRIMIVFLCALGVLSFVMATVSVESHQMIKVATALDPQQKTPKLATMFTTARATAEKLQITKNTIKNWSLLKETAHLIFYSPGNLSHMDEQLSAYAAENGFHVRECPRMLHGVPVVRSMFIDAQNISKSLFYAYANADILFTDGLPNSLQALVVYQKRFKEMLIVGRRSNYNIKRDDNFTDWTSVKRASRLSTLFETYAQDYFITSKNGFPWNTIPNFVVGRIGYDNWLVATSILKDIPVFDLTQTVLALHQTGVWGNRASRQNLTKSESNFNLDLAGKFDYSLGHTDCAQFASASNGTAVSLKFIEQNPCHKKYKIHGKNSLLFKDNAVTMASLKTAI